MVAFGTLISTTTWTGFQTDLESDFEKFEPTVVEELSAEKQDLGDLDFLDVAVSVLSINEELEARISQRLVWERKVLKSYVLPIQKRWIKI